MSRFFLVSCLVGVALVEIGLRLIDYSRPPFARYSELTGAELRPDTEGWYVKENRIKLRINGEGLRGPDVSGEKPPGSFRILILGDSFAKALKYLSRRSSRVWQSACWPIAHPTAIMSRSSTLAFQASVRRRNCSCSAGGPAAMSPISSCFSSPRSTTCGTATRI